MQLFLSICGAVQGKCWVGGGGSAHHRLWRLSGAKSKWDTQSLCRLLFTGTFGS